MKSTEKFVEIMEKLTGVSVGSQVTFKENTYEVAGINTDELTALVSLKCEGQEDISVGLKELVESEEYVIEAKCKEQDNCDDDEEDKDMMDEADDDTKDDKEKDAEPDDDPDDKDVKTDKKDMEEKKK